MSTGMSRLVGILPGKLFTGTFLVNISERGIGADSNYSSLDVFHILHCVVRSSLDPCLTDKLEKADNSFPRVPERHPEDAAPRLLPRATRPRPFPRG